MRTKPNICGDPADGEGSRVYRRESDHDEHEERDDD